MVLLTITSRQYKWLSVPMNSKFLNMSIEYLNIVFTGNGIQEFKYYKSVLYLSKKNKLRSLKS